MFYGLLLCKLAKNLDHLTDRVSYFRKQEVNSCGHRMES